MVEPIALPLEWVSWQSNAPPLIRLIKSTPIDLGPSGCQPAQASQQVRPVVPITAERGQGQKPRVWVRLLSKAQQRGLRANFDDRCHPVIKQAGQSWRKLNR